jgi:copper transport protein
MKRLAVLLAALFGVGVLLAGPASAHAALIGSDPADGARLQSVPHRVTLIFDEAVGLSDIGYLHVTDEHGSRVDAGKTYHPNGDGSRVAEDLRDGLGDDSYTVSYRVISADSHPIAGTIAFVVGTGPLIRAPTTSASAVDPVTGDAFDVARWISYAGLVFLGGGWLLFTLWPAGREDARARRVVWAGWIGLTAGAVFELLLQGTYTAGSGLGDALSRTLLTDTLHTDYGRLHSIRLLLLGALGLVLARSVRTDVRRARLDIAVDLLAGALGLAVVWTMSRSGHPATTSPTWLSTAIDMAHLVSVAVWLGGLIMLVTAVLPRREPDELRTALPAFSRVALGAVVLLVASGTYSAWRGIGTVHAVFTTIYGWLVVGKVALLAGILVVANLSRRLVNSRTVAYALSPDTVVQAAPVLTDDEVRIERLRRSVAIEAVIGLVVLGFSAVLVAEPRGKEALLASYRDPVSAVAPLPAGRSLEISAAPGVHGHVSFAVHVSGGAEPKSISATATQHDLGIGPLKIKLVSHVAGVYDGSALLPAAGQWEIDFVVTRSRFDATTTDATITLH